MTWWIWAMAGVAVGVIVWILGQAYFRGEL
jgi:hypothetical protein